MSLSSGSFQPHCCDFQRKFPVNSKLYTRSSVVLTLTCIKSQKVVFRTKFTCKFSASKADLES
uniref:Uncharacterized protein n=1 Tax=Tetraselmis sp. GSL018 TaxID=582737 RepID=A0A061RZJ0_9CHLO